MTTNLSAARRGGSVLARANGADCITSRKFLVPCRFAVVVPGAAVVRRRPRWRAVPQPIQAHSSTERSSCCRFARLPRLTAHDREPFVPVHLSCARAPMFQADSSLQITDLTHLRRRSRRDDVKRLVSQGFRSPAGCIRTTEIPVDSHEIRASSGTRVCCRRNGHEHATIFLDPACVGIFESKERR